MLGLMAYWGSHKDKIVGLIAVHLVQHLIIPPIKNVKVKITSTDGSISETGNTNKNGFCYFKNIPTNIEYEIEATHISWTQENVE